jgi:hypothetical protein
MRSLIGLLLCGAVLGAACSGSGNGSTSDGSIDAASATVEATAAEASAEQRFPDIVDATAEQTSLGWTFDVTVSSPYDSADRYADAWRIVGPDGAVYGTRELAHDHAAEQPFTRTVQAVEIPDDVDVVTIEGRDQVHGWGGGTFELALTRS